MRREVDVLEVEGRMCVLTENVWTSLLEQREIEWARDTEQDCQVALGINRNKFH